jgi:hypothetical protein
VQNSFKTETTKTVATQVDPSNNNQLVRTGVVAKEESSSTNPVDSTAFPTTPTKSVSKEVNKDSTIVMTKEETTTEMTSDDSKQVSDSVDKNFKL